MAGVSTRRHVSLLSIISYRVFVSATCILLFLASLSVLLSSPHHHHHHHQQDPNSPSSSSSSTTDNHNFFLWRGRRFLSSEEEPLRLRLHLLRQHSLHHLSLIHAFSSLSLRLKLSSSRSLDSFVNLSHSLSDLSSRIYSLANSNSNSNIDEDSLRLIEKEAKDKIKLARQVISESKESFDTQLKIQKLRDTIFAVNEQLAKAKKLGSLSSTIAAGSTPKSIHCLNMRLMGEKINDPKRYRNPNSSSPDLVNPDLYHYVIFSDNVIAVSVVVNSVIKNANEPKKQVFHVVTDKMYVAAMQVWFVRRPPSHGAHVEVRSLSDFASVDQSANLDYMRFYLPEMFPRLKKIVLLEDDVVVQKDLSGLWRVDLDGKVNGAVEMCFGGFRRYEKYMNFSSPFVREKFNPRACAWGFGVNLFDLDAWRREQCTDEFLRYQSLNKDGTLWNPATVLPAGLMTFSTTTKPLDKSWHVMGLGYNPNVSQDEIRNAAVIHFNGNMKPWLDVAMNQYKHLWTKFVDTEMEFLPLCNFGL